MSEHEHTPPQKVRVTKLQEAQLAELVTIEADCAESYHAIGFSSEQVKARTELQLAALPRHHDVLVAEADDCAVAFLAWADQAPGIAWLPTLMVSSMHQRYGIATHLLRELGEIARGHGIAFVVTPCWDRAPWGMSFLAVRGFQPVEQGGLPEKVATWKSTAPEDLIVPGQKLWWAKTDGLGTIPGLPRPDSVR